MTTTSTATTRGLARPGGQEVGVDFGAGEEVLDAGGLVDGVAVAARGAVADRGDFGALGEEVHVRETPSD